MINTIRIALTTVALASSLAAQTATFQPHEYKSSGGTVIQAELGEFKVPENRTKSGSREITLRFVRFKSANPSPGHPIVYLAGGPGGSGIEAVRGTRFPLAMALREFGDVIAYDQRGINRSGPDMTCNEQFAVAPNEPLDRAKAGAAMNAAAKTCVDRLRASGVDVGAYNTRESAADLDALRKALGAKKLVLWGISYGTHLSIATLRYHPDAVDRVILAGIEGAGRHVQTAGRSAGADGGHRTARGTRRQASRSDRGAAARAVRRGSAGAQPFAIRPMSETEFFYEGQPSALRFEVDPRGKVVAMVFRGADGVDQRAARE